MVQIHSAEEDSEDSQELPVDPQAAVLATSANQVKPIQTVQNMTRNSLPPHEAFLGVLWGVLKWVPFWNTLVLRLLNWSKASRYWTLSRQRPQNMASCYGLFRHFPFCKYQNRNIIEILPKGWKTENYFVKEGAAGALAASRARWWEVVGNSEIVKSGIKRVNLPVNYTNYTTSV